MDASQNNDFGSFTNGEAGAGTPISSADASGASNVPVAPNVQVTSNMPMTPNAQVAPSMPLSSGSGDIVLVPDTQTSGERRKWIVAGLIALIVVAAIAAVVLFFIMRGQNGGQASKGEVKKAFNEYANYVLFGKESSEDFDIETINGKPYFLTLDDEENERYLKNADDKYWKFEKAYYDNGGAEDVEPLKAFYQDYASVQLLTLNRIASYYSYNDKTFVESLIKDRYQLVDGMNQDLHSLLIMEKELADLELKIVIDADSAGCLDSQGLISGCYTISDEEKDELSNLTLSTVSIIDAIESKAKSTVEMVYDDIYGIESNEEKDL